MFFVPFNLIQVQHYTATAAGAAFLPLILLIFLLSRWVGGLVDRYGPRVPLVVGPLIAALGFALFAVPGIGSSYWVTFFPAMLVLGVGMAISVAPLTTAVLGAVGPHRMGIASGINNAISRAGSLLAIAVLGTFVLNTFNSGLDHRLASIQLPGGIRTLLDQQRMRLAAVELSADMPAELWTLLEQAIAESFVDSFRLVMFIAAGLAMASAFVAFQMITPATARQRSGGH